MSAPSGHDDPAESSDQGGESVDPTRTESRAELLPEEAGMSVQDPEALAAAVLAESDQRTDDPAAGTSRDEVG